MTDEAVAETILVEFKRAKVKYPKRFNSMHEAYAVVLEELDEVWDEIKGKNYQKALEEMIQVGAMAFQFIKEFGLAQPQWKQKAVSPSG